MARKTKNKYSMHDKKYHRTYCLWTNMRLMCTKENHNRYKYFGARGITFPKRWNKFDNFVDDVGIAPEGMSTNLINRKKSFSKNNFQWSTKKQIRIDTIRVIESPINKILRKISDETGLSIIVLRARYKHGWALDDIATRKKWARKKKQSKVAEMINHIPEDATRNKKIVMLSENGCTYRNISEYFGVTYQRISQIVKSERLKQKMLAFKVSRLY